MRGGPQLDGFSQRDEFGRVGAIDDEIDDPCGRAVGGFQTQGDQGYGHAFGQHAQTVGEGADGLVLGDRYDLGLKLSIQVAEITQGEGGRVEIPIDPLCQF